MRELPVPAHFDPDRVGEVWRVPYKDRAREATAWAAQHGIRRAAEDSFRVCLLAVDDNRRLGTNTGLIEKLLTHYTDEADAAFERYVAAGMQWPTFATSS